MKTENILVDRNFVVKLCDLGVSKSLSSQQDKRSTRTGTEFFVAPEICSG